MGLDRHDLHGSVTSFELSFSDLFVLFYFSCVANFKTAMYLFENQSAPDRISLFS